MAEIDPALLAALLARDEAKVQQALDRVHDGTGVTMPLAFIFGTNPAKPEETALIEYLEAFLSVDKFIGALQALGEAIELNAAPMDAVQAIKDASIDPAAYAAFVTAAKAFRCRIRVNGQIMGSGVLVSYRMVLTAWHVINQAQPWPADAPPLIEVLTSDGQILVARPSDPSSPCHPKELAGLIPDDAELAGHDDFALLRLSQPAGFALGFATPTCPPPVWQGSIPCLLVHFPLGADVGHTPGEATFGNAARRFRHTAPGDGGSSGGALFSNTTALIGIHQKQIDAERRFVPIRNFANDDSAALIQVLRHDGRPTYLWSLDGSLDSPLVIGRRALFDALDQMIDGSGPGADRLRGVWMRRKQANLDLSGTGFGFDLLRAFLARRQPDALLTRLALQAGDNDLFALFEAAFDTLGLSSTARAGVREDETTAVAFAADRADALIRAIEAKAGRPVWIYIDGPKEELSETVVRQLEQVLARLTRSASIRFVLTRMESHRLPLARFETLSEIGELSQPGVFHEYVGDFGLEDVRITLRAACADLGLGLAEAVIDDIADLAVKGVPTAFGLYPSSELDAVAQRLVAALRPRVEAA